MQRDRAVDVGLAGHRGAREHLAGRRLAHVAELARSRLDALTVDEEAVIALVATAISRSLASGASRSPMRTCSVSSVRKRAGSPPM